jgi:AraC-like DNA-binding protein
MEQLKALMRFKPTKADAAAVMKCSEDTLERRIRETFNQTYIEFQEQHKAPVKIKLRQLALDKALKGDDYWLTKCNEEFGWCK